MFKKLVQKGNAHVASCKAKGRTLVVFGLMAIMTFAMSVVTFAADPVEVAITAEMVEPIADYVIANIAVLMPVGITVFGVLIGVALIPRVVRRFTSV